MYQASRKITASGFLLLMALPLVFSLAVVIKQKVIQFQRRERLEQESLQTIIVSAEKIYWVKTGKEALVDGKLFDVESFRGEGKIISLTGFFDINEDKVVQHIKNLTELEKEPGNAYTSLLVVKFLFAPVYNESNGFSLQSPWQAVSRPVSSYTEMIPDGFFPADTPPPKFC